MKLKSRSLTAFAAMLLIAALTVPVVYWLHPPLKLDGLQIFCYPGLEWGMTMEEARNALGIEEGWFRESYQLDHTVYTDHGVTIRRQEFLGKEVQIIFRFAQFSYSDEPRLAGMIISGKMMGSDMSTDEPAEEYFGLIEDWLKEQGAEYTIRTEKQKDDPDRLGRYIGENDPRYDEIEGEPGHIMAYFESTSDLRDQPKRYQESFNEIYNQQVKMELRDPPEGWSIGNPYDVRDGGVRLPLVTLEATYLYPSGERDTGVRGGVLINAWEMAHLIAYSKK